MAKGTKPKQSQAARDKQRAKFLRSYRRVHRLVETEDE